MQHDSQSHPTQATHAHVVWYQTLFSVAGAMAALILAFYLLREHWRHIAGNWSYILLLVCPLMHLRHSGHHGHGRHPRDPDNSGNERR